MEIANHMRLADEFAEMEELLHGRRLWVDEVGP